MSCVDPLNLRPHFLTRAGVEDNRGPVKSRDHLREKTKIENTSTDETNTANHMTDMKDSPEEEVRQVLQVDPLSKRRSSEASRFPFYRGST